MRKVGAGSRREGCAGLLIAETINERHTTSTTAAGSLGLQIISNACLGMTLAGLAVDVAASARFAKHFAPAAQHCAVKNHPTSRTASFRVAGILSSRPIHLSTRFTARDRGNVATG